MKKRIITAVVYVIVLIGLLVLKWLVPDGWGSLGFDALFCAVSIIGSVELLRAVKSVSFPQKTITVAFCAVAVPLYVLVQIAAEFGLVALAIAFCVYALVLAVVNLCHLGESSLRGTLISLFTVVYCGVLSCILSAVNHLADNSLAAVLMLFFTVMFTDAGAFIIGSIFKRWIPLKLAPALSPNKTVIGGVGGLIGGMLGAIVAYYIHFGLTKVIGTPLVYGGGVPAVVVFLMIGLIASILAQIGDLFESGIKRKCEIKDMGKLLPGHGGVLDRFDSMLFSGVVVFIGFIILAL